MSSDEERFVDELFMKIKGPNPAKEISDAIALLKQGQGDVNSVLSAIQKYSSQLESRNEFRKASFQYYTGVRIIKEFFEDKNTENQWLLKVSDLLIKASAEYTTWEDIDGGAACMTMAALLRILAGHWEVPQFMTEFTEKFKDQITQGKYASGMVYIPYDILNSVNDIKAELIQRAESYTETYLFSHKATQLFRDSVREVLDIARKKMMDKIKLPRIQATANFPPDIIFGEEFTTKVVIANEGEGEAKTVTCQADIPHLVNLVSGDATFTYQELKPGENYEVNYRFICPTGEGATEIQKDFKIGVTYQDLLGNKRTTQLGPFEIVIRQFRKTDELNLKLEKQLADNAEILSSLKENEKVEAAAIALEFWNQSIDSCKEQIAGGKFGLAEEGLELLSKFMTNVGKTTADLARTYENDKTNVKDTLKIMSEELDKAKNNVDKMKSNFEKALTP
ncbi:MAG: hypothetical protein ACXAEU_17340 [Candidatus Hodarchaeales archaeon]